MNIDSIVYGILRHTHNTCTKIILCKANRTLELKFVNSAYQIRYVIICTICMCGCSYTALLEDL